MKSFFVGVSTFLACSAFIMSDASAGTIHPAAAPIIEKTMTAYGGIEKLKQVKRITATGATKAFLKNDEGVLTRYQEFPRRFRADVVYRHSEETRIVNGTAGWRSFGPGVLEPAKGSQLDAMRFQNKHLELPFSLLNDGYDISFMGQDVVHGVITDVLSVTDSEGPEMLVHVDPKTGLIIRISGIIKGGAIETTLSSDFSDYRLHEGIMMPHMIISYGGPDKTAETILSDIMINPHIPAAIFTPTTLKGGTI